MASKKLNIQIDSNYIKPLTSDQLPTELRALGVNAFNEKEFEKGALLQVDLQLAEYELNQIRNGSDFDDDYADPVNGEHSTAKKLDGSGTKRKEKIVESYRQKKAKLESKLEDYKNYLEDASHRDDVSKTLNHEDLVKLGEVTPFGSRLDLGKRS
jgi:hypothetical protein